MVRITFLQYTYLTVTAYACNYQANFVTTPILNAMANEEEDVCGSSQKGFYRCTNGCQISKHNFAFWYLIF